MRKFLFIISCISVFFACVERVEWTEITEPILVIEGGVSNESRHHEIVLTKSFGVNQAGVEYIEDAVVKVSDGVREFDFSYNNNAYISNEVFSAVPGMNYELSVELAKPIDGHTLFNAIVGVPIGMDVDSASAEVNRDIDFSSALFEFDITYYGQDPISVDNYYEVSVYIDGDLESPEDLVNVELFTDQGMPGGYVERSISLNTFLTDFDGENDTVFIDAKEQDVAEPSYDSIEVRLYSYDQEYFDYLVRTQTQLINAQDFLGVSNPVAKPSSNISNGAKGYFSGTYVSNYFIVSDEDE